MTVPLATLLGLAERPGEIPGLGPVDPALARDLARAAAADPQTTWRVTVTDDQGRATGHGCARPEPASHARIAQHPGPRPGPPGGYGHWRLATGVPGHPDLLIALDPVALDTCDHRFGARGHDPGVKLRHPDPAPALLRQAGFAGSGFVT